MTDWEKRHADTFSDAAWRDYRGSVKHLRRALGGDYAHELTFEHFEDFKDACLKGFDFVTERFDARKLSNTTVNKRLDIASRVLKDAIKLGRISGPNPVELVARPSKKSPGEGRPVIRDPEQRKLIAAAPTLQMRVHTRMLCELALRWSETAGFPIDAYDPETKEITIRQVAIEVRRPKPARMVIKRKPKRKKSYRRLECSGKLAAEIEQLIAESDGKPNPHGLLLTDENGGILRHNNWMRDKWRPMRKAAGLAESGITPHGLRHSRISQICEAHTDIWLLAVQNFAGHDDLQQTLEYAKHFQKPGLKPDQYLTGNKDTGELVTEEREDKEPEGGSLGATGL